MATKKGSHYFDWPH